jgi:hypothetical protein
VEFISKANIACLKIIVRLKILKMRVLKIKRKHQRIYALKISGQKMMEEDTVN